MPAQRDPRLEKNDGSDFQYRMSIDNKYRRAAKCRKLLEKLNSAQAFFALSSALMSASLLGRPKHQTEHPELPWWQIYASSAASQVQQLTILEAVPIYAVFAAAFASVIGLRAVKGNRPYFLRLQALLSLIASGACLWPLLSGTSFSACTHEYGLAKASEDYTWFSVVLIRSLQELLGFFVNVAIVLTAMDLASTMIVPKRD